MGKDVTIRTYTGQLVNLLDPDPETLLVEDVAHHLSQINRFTGATVRPYSVAEHCILGRLAIDTPHKLHFLVHDAPEAWLGDVSGPLKCILAPLYKPLEAMFWERFASKYGIPLDLAEEVHVMDKRMLMTEQRDLMSRPPRPGDEFQPLSVSISTAAMHSVDMRERWLLAFWEEMARPERWSHAAAAAGG